MLPPELPISQSDTIVLATFSDYQPRFSESRSSIYTEISLSVEQVLLGGPNAVRVGDRVETFEYGGVIKLPTGRVTSFGCARGRFALQPDRRYVLFLEYEADGADYVLKSWELRDHRVYPNSFDDELRKYYDVLKYSGAEESVFIAAIREALAGSLESRTWKSELAGT